MARSPFTLAAAVTAAVPGAEVVGARALSADGDGRFDSAVATLADGREVAIRVASDDETSAELASEAIALRALTAGAREMLPFAVPEALGETRVGEARALVSSLVPGFQVEAAHIPAGRGAATAIGAAIAGIHALPLSVVRAAGLGERTPEQVREDIRELVDRAAATGRVSARLTVRWREAVETDDVWRFESAVVLGGAHAGSFLFEDDPDFGPEVSGVIGWHGLRIGDPAADLAWLASAPDAREDVHSAYASATLRSPDPALRVRSRLLAELEFARWLLHGDETRRPDIVDDAAQLLDSLAEGIRTDDLVPRRGPGAGVDEAMVALESVPATATAEVDTSMQTDAYDPSAFAGIAADDTAAFGPRHDTGESPAADRTVPGTDGADPDDTAPIDLDGEAFDAAGLRPDDGPADDRASSSPAAAVSSDEEEAQRAARAAFQRWSNSSSE